MYQYERADRSLIPVVKTMEYRNRNTDQTIDYFEMFQDLTCIKEIMIPNIKNNYNCISALKHNKDRFVKAKLLEFGENLYKIAIYDCYTQGIAFFDISKRYFIIDEMDFLNYRMKEKSQRHYKKQWVL